MRWKKATGSGGATDGCGSMSMGLLLPPLVLLVLLVSVPPAAAAAAAASAKASVMDQEQEDTKKSVDSSIHPSTPSNRHTPTLTHNTRTFGLRPQPPPRRHCLLPPHVRQGVLHLPLQDALPIPRALPCPDQVQSGCVIQPAASVECGLNTLPDHARAAMEASPVCIRSFDRSTGLTVPHDIEDDVRWRLLPPAWVGVGRQEEAAAGRPLHRSLRLDRGGQVARSPRSIDVGIGWLPLLPVRRCYQLDDRRLKGVMGWLG